MPTVQNWINPGSFETRDVASGTGFLRFRLASSDVTFRVSTVLSIEEGEQSSFTLIANTVVVRESDNASGTLSLFAQ